MTVIDKEPAIRREPPGFSDTRILIKVTDRALCLDVVPVSHGYVVSVYLVSKYIDVGISVLRIQVDQLPVIVQLHSFCLKRGCAPDSPRFTGVQSQPPEAQIAQERSCRQVT